MFNDEYPTCDRTHATLCIYPGETDPTAISMCLDIEPSSWQRQGEVILRPGRPSKVAKINGWFLESRGQVESKDSQRHIDWILDQVAPKGELIRSLQDDGSKMSISCYWLSRHGHGGPIVSPAQMRRLGELNIELWFDFYGPFDEV